MKIVPVTTPEQMDEAWKIRLEVFVGEQKVPLEEEVDAIDTAPTTLHALVYDDAGVPVATGRVFPGDHPGDVHVGRVAVVARMRGNGTGAALMRALEDLAFDAFAVDGPAAPSGTGQRSVRLKLSAQEAAMGFYGRLGYEVVSGERYLDAGIWHQDMAKVRVG